MKIALIQCPVWGTYDPPLALAQLSSCLKKDGQEVFVFDLNIRLYLNRAVMYKDAWAWEQSLLWYNEKAVDSFFSDNNAPIAKYAVEMVNTDSRVFAFSVNAASRLASLKVARLIKGINQNAIIVFGGPLFFEERFIDAILQENAVDIVIPGEGEFALLELIHFIDRKRDLDDCLGISFKHNGRIIKNAARTPVPNLDVLPFLDFTDLPLSQYDDSRHISFMASRGCIQGCVFCSSRAFWPGYRTMSGRRIFEEVKFHKKSAGTINPDLGHIDFIDLLFNGNMRSLIEFCDLLREAKLDLKWTANMIIRPEMTSDVIKKMSDSGCEHIIFGIESASERVLALMKKHYRIEDAERIIRTMHKMGIIVTGNFMFGFPGETEDDFQQTLNFVKRNSEFIDRVYPSRTYCAIEEFSYLYSHLEEFGIKPPNPQNHLFWESFDGKNTYPVRLRRCREFSQLASSLKIEVGCGVQTSVELDEHYNLGFYYDFRKDYLNAIKHFLNYHNLDSRNEIINEKLSFYHQKIEREKFDIAIDNEAVEGLSKAIVNIKEGEKEILSNTLLPIGRERSIHLMKHKQKENSLLNDQEFKSKKIGLNSSPKDFFLEVAGPCNSKCVFCSRGKEYSFFNLTGYKRRFEEKLDPYLVKAERIIFIGQGEVLLINESREILDYFDDKYPHVEKIVSTNGSSLTPDICERIANNQSRYTIQISLHASNSDLHRALTRTSNFQKIISQINYLMEYKRKTGNPTVQFIFLANTLNIEDLPDFVRLSAHFGIDKLICYYNYVYIPTQKYLSCFFKQRVTNKILDEADNLASRLNLRIELPPRFCLKINEYPEIRPCREAWSQIKLNFKGQVISCDISEETNETLEKKDFIEIWNSQYYSIRRMNLLEGKASCFFHCYRANPRVVNNFFSHVVYRGKDARYLITEFWEDSL